MAIFARQNLRLLLKKIRAPTRLVPIRLQGSSAAEDDFSDDDDVKPLSPEEREAVLKMERKEKEYLERMAAIGFTIINQVTR